MSVSSISPQPTIFSPSILKAQSPQVAVADHDGDADDFGGPADSDGHIDIKA